VLGAVQQLIVTFPWSNEITWPENGFQSLFIHLVKQIAQDQMGTLEIF